MLPPGAGGAEPLRPSGPKPLASAARLAALAQEVGPDGAWAGDAVVARQGPALPPIPAPQPLGARLKAAWARGKEDAGWTGRPAWQCQLWRCAGELSQGLWGLAERHAWARGLQSGIGKATAWGYRAWGAIAQRIQPIPIPPPPAPEPLGPVLPRFPGGLGWLSTQGPRIVDEAGKPVVLRGINLPGMEYMDPAKAEAVLPEATLDFLAKQGATWVRLPINQEKALKDEGYRRELDELLRRANARGLYVAMDMHWAKEGGGQVEHADADTLRLWRLLAHRYREQPGLIIDLHNEPGFHSWAQQAELSEAILAQVRAVNPKVLAMVEGTAKAQNLAGVLERPVRDPNVAYQVHVYGPKQHLAGVGPSQWQALFGEVAKQHPVVVGEFGGDDEERPAMEAVLRFTREEGLAGWAWWPDHAHQRPLDPAQGISAWGHWLSEALRQG